MGDMVGGAADHWIRDPLIQPQLGVDEGGTRWVGEGWELVSRLVDIVSHNDPDLVFSSDWDASGVHLFLTSTMWSNVTHRVQLFRLGRGPKRHSTTVSTNHRRTFTEWGARTTMRRFFHGRIVTDAVRISEAFGETWDPWS